MRLHILSRQKLLFKPETEVCFVYWWMASLPTSIQNILLFITHHLSTQSLSHHRITTACSPHVGVQGLRRRECIEYLYFFLRKAQTNRGHVVRELFWLA